MNLSNKIDYDWLLTLFVGKHSIEGVNEKKIFNIKNELKMLTLATLTKTSPTRRTESKTWNVNSSKWALHSDRKFPWKCVFKLSALIQGKKSEVETSERAFCRCSLLQVKFQMKNWASHDSWCRVIVRSRVKDWGLLAVRITFFNLVSNHW